MKDWNPDLHTTPVEGLKPVTHAEVEAMEKIYGYVNQYHN